MRNKNSHTKTNAVHGGRVYEASRRWRIAPEQILDFSANINPLGPPATVLSAAAKGVNGRMLRSYPETGPFVDAVTYRHELSPESIVVGNGVAALLFAAMRALASKRVAILEPAFSEYRRACAAAGAGVVSFQLKANDDFLPDFPALVKAIDSQSFDCLIINNPHNPSGAVYPKEELLRLVEIASAKNIAVVIDEAFIDYVPEASLLSAATGEKRVIVMRSLTKHYAMPGLRIGYAVCGAMLADRFRAQMDAWPISTVALEAGRAALSEMDFEERSRRGNAEAREEFALALTDLGLKVFPSSANFLLVELPYRPGEDLERWLEPARILIRRCNSFPGLGDQYIRLAVRSRADNLRLLELIAEWLTSVS